MKEIKRGDIYFADLDPIKGSEQGGVRPVLVLQNDVGNRYSSTTIIVPITSHINKSKMKTHVKICDALLPKQSVALLEQIRTIDKCRLRKYISNLEKDKMKEINQAIAVDFDMINC